MSKCPTKIYIQTSAKKAPGCVLARTRMEEYTHIPSLWHEPKERPKWGPLILFKDDLGMYRTGQITKPCGPDLIQTDIGWEVWRNVKRWAYVNELTGEEVNHD